jgi:hypothetical protein
MQREAMARATRDLNSVPTQIWYDTLRETDDGRFSDTVILQNDLDRVKQSTK